MNPQPTLGARIRARRQALGLTLAVVAPRAGVSVSYLSDVERGRRLPSLDALDRIARALSCVATDLLEGLYPYGLDVPDSSAQPG